MVLVYILIALNFLLVGVVVKLYCFSRAGVEFNHIFLFSLGFATYWIIPILVGVMHLFDDIPPMVIWYSIFDTISPGILVLYLSICLICYLCFWGGTVAYASLHSRQTEHYRLTFFDSRVLWFYLGLGGAAAALYAFVLRGDLFRGYTTGSVYDISELGTRGAFIAASNFLMGLAVVYTLKRDEQFDFNLPFKKIVINPFTMVYLISAILVASTGGRLYLVSSILMLLVYRSVYFQPLKSRIALGVIGGTLALAGAVGVVRLGASLNLTDALFNLASEPMFNSFSLIRFLSDGHFDLLRFPLFLFSDLTNLLPSALFPDKIHWLADPADYGFAVFAPLGALNSYFSFVTNFGVLGTFLMIFLFSFVLCAFKIRKPGLLSRTFYIMLSGWLATTFFRDPFSVSLVKAMLEFSILMPLLFVLTAHIVSTIWRETRERRAAENRQATAND